MEDITTRVVQIWVGDSYMEVEVNQPDDWDEDTLYHEVCDYVLSNISIDILQETQWKAIEMYL